jgi:segregation and condensation protein B
MDNLLSQLESLLFVSAKALATKQLLELTGVSQDDLTKALEALTERYSQAGSGLSLLHDNHKYQLVTNSNNSELIKSFLHQELNSDLSRPSLETLTIIAYRGPIAKSDLDRIRGINCSQILRNLLLRGLVEIKSGYKDGETYYQVTFDFLKFLGLASLSDLPDYDRLHHDQAVEQFLGQQEVTDPAPTSISESAINPSTQLD